MTVAVCPVRPESRGTIMAQSPDPLSYPAIRPNYLSAPSDLRVLIAGVNHTRRIFSQPAMAPYTVEETVPGPAVSTDDDFGRFARTNGTNVFHPVGTCKMGTDPMAVVDPRSVGSMAYRLDSRGSTTRSCPGSRPAIPTRRRS